MKHYELLLLAGCICTSAHRDFQRSRVWYDFLHLTFSVTYYRLYGCLYHARSQRESQITRKPLREVSSLVILVYDLDL